MCGYKEGMFLDLDSYQCGRRAQKSPSSLHSRWHHKCKVCAVAKITWKWDCLTAYFIEKYTFWRTHFSSYFIPLHCPFETGPHVTQAAYKLCVAMWLELLSLLLSPPECWDYRCLKFMQCWGWRWRPHVAKQALDPLRPIPPAQVLILYQVMFVTFSKIKC